MEKSKLDMLFEKWQKLIDEHECCDISVSPYSTNMIKNWCIKNKYYYKFSHQFQDTFVYVVSKSKKLLLEHEKNR